MKGAFLVLVLLLTACSPGTQREADRNAEKVQQDVKRGVDKVKNAPGTKQLETDVKRGFREADAAVTRQLEKGRQKVRDEAGKLKEKAAQ